MNRKLFWERFALISSLFLVVFVSWLFSRTLVAVWIPASALLALAVLMICIAPRLEMESAPALSPPRLQALIPTLLAAWLLLPNLGRVGDPLFTWEEPVIGGFVEALRSGISGHAFLQRLIAWDAGLMSSGEYGMLYGGPTYFLLRLFGGSLWSLRIAAAICMIAAVWLLAEFARKYVHKDAGVWAAVFFAISPQALLYGHYGSTPAATILSAIATLFLFSAFLESARPSYFLSFLCALSTALMTLAYSPGRLIALLLLATAGIVLVIQRRRLSVQHYLGAGLILVLLLGFVWVQYRMGALSKFFNARGEQLFFLMRDRELANQLLGSHLNIEPTTVFDKLRFTWALITKVTGPQLLHMLVPQEIPPEHCGFLYDPPPFALYLAPLVGLLILGLVRLGRGWRRPSHLLLLSWLLLGPVPLLLTNRFDTHRSVLLVVPLAVVTALGAQAAWEMLAAIRLPRLFIKASQISLLIAIVYVAAGSMSCARGELSTLVRALEREISSLKEPLVLGAQVDSKSAGYLQLLMIERMRRDPQWHGQLMAEHVRNALLNRQDSGWLMLSTELRRHIADGSAVILAPGRLFESTAHSLGSEVDVRRRQYRGFSYFLLGRRGQPDAIADSPGEEGQDSGELPLGSLKPDKNEFGFAPLSIDQTPDNQPLRINVEEYDRGLWMHAPSVVVYKLPEEALRLRADIGLSDQVRFCEAASVVFEIWDDRGRRLFRGPLMKAGEPPRPISVPLAGAKEIRLVADDAGNGRDCDHGVWGAPVIVLKKSERIASGSSSSSSDQMPIH